MENRVSRCGVVFRLPETPNRHYGVQNANVPQSKSVGAAARRRVHDKITIHDFFRLPLSTRQKIKYGYF